MANTNKARRVTQGVQWEKKKMSRRVHGLWSAYKTIDRQGADDRRMVRQRGRRRRACALLQVPGTQVPAAASLLIGAIVSLNANAL